MDCSLPGSSVHGIFQTKILEWVAISFSKEIPSLAEEETGFKWSKSLCHSPADWGGARIGAQNPAFTALHCPYFLGATVSA